MIPTVFLTPRRPTVTWAPRTPTLRLGPERETIDRQAGEDVQAAVEAEAAHQVPLARCGEGLGLGLRPFCFVGSGSALGRADRSDLSIHLFRSERLNRQSPPSRKPGIARLAQKAVDGGVVAVQIVGDLLERHERR